MAAVRRTHGTPFQTTKSGDDASRLEVWDYQEGSNVRQYRFRWGTLVEGCMVEVFVITP